MRCSRSTENSKSRSAKTKRARMSNSWHEERDRDTESTDRNLFGERIPRAAGFRRYVCVCPECRLRCRRVTRLLRGRHSALSSEQISLVNQWKCAPMPRESALEPFDCARPRQSGACACMRCQCAPNNNRRSCRGRFSWSRPPARINSGFCLGFYAVSPSEGLTWFCFAWVRSGLSGTPGTGTSTSTRPCE